ncbi:MAG: transglycosylase domain-containing protein [Clostridia bacterium]|nr:transglycosylase domain-containing protein [Clostridia bacterium]
MKKIIFKLFFWILIILLIIFSIILGLGYLKYKEAVDKISVTDRVQEIRENEKYTKLEDISVDYKNAVVAIEDHRFYSHSGIDVLSIIRSTYVNLRSKSLDYGASTITQQVGRLMYFSQEKSFIRKVSEIFVAFELEKNYSKDEILELYLNLIYFGNGYYGINDASEGFFDKSPKDLSFYEATYLAGLPNAPSIYSENDELAEERRLQVVNAMKKYGYIDE